jgi:hypothetical protein
MESQNNGFSKPSLSLGQQNSLEGWQPTIKPPTPSFDTNQPGLAHPVPLKASDSDLVETEWVDAAKRIMQTYKSDPYNKNRALTFLRADYLKKRYNKDLKIPEN